MSHKIFGREKEIKELARLLDSQQPEFLALYGRRRVGKTYLIHEFYKDKGLFFSITGSFKSSKKSQLHKFYVEMQRIFSFSNEQRGFKDWEEALYDLYTEVSKIDSKKKVIIFFDELPWLASSRSGFLSALEYLWNQYLSKMNNIILIVCGSAANWIIKKIINNTGGLYGRLTAILKLNPFTLSETEKFLAARHVELSRKQLIELYMTFGGIAKYLTFLHSGESYTQAVNRLCFLPKGELVHEFTNLYQSLFKDAHIHMQIVKKLSEKKKGMTQEELLDEIKISSGGRTTEILNELEETGFIVSYPTFHKKVREKRWRLIDEYTYFYLTWMEKMKGSILLGNDENYWLKMHETQMWKTWSGYAFESIVYKHIPQLKRALGISAVLTFESQWTYTPKLKSEKGAQIDLLIDRRDDCINLCEIKFHNSPFTIDKKYAEELEYKIQIFREKSKTKKTIFLTMITPFGIVKNQHSLGVVHQEVTLDSFFSD